MKTLPSLILLLLLLGCKEGFLTKNSVETIAMDGFSVNASSDWQPFKLQGIDSKVGGLRNSQDELRYDLGWFSYNFQNETSDTHIRKNTIIDGRKALIVKPKNKGAGLIGLYVQIDDLNRLAIYGTSKNEKEIMKILESVKIL